MKATGIVRRIDDLGRIVIPKEIRKMIFGTQDATGKPMEFFMDGNTIVLQKYEDVEERKNKEIRAKAIDEFVNLVNECSGYTPNCIEHDLSLTVYTIHQIAEQLKGGAE